MARYNEMSSPCSCRYLDRGLEPTPFHTYPVEHLRIALACGLLISLENGGRRSPPKPWYLSTKLHAVMTQKTIGTCSFRQEILKSESHNISCDNVFGVVSFVLCYFVFEPSLVHFSRGGKINTLVCDVFVCEGKRKIGTNVEEGWKNRGKVEPVRANNNL